jgi:hypothetical protein
VQAVLRNASVGANLQSLRAIVNHYLPDDEYIELCDQLGRILQYRNLVVHRWRHKPAVRLRRPDGDPPALLRGRPQVGRHEISRTIMEARAVESAQVAFRLEELRTQLIELGRTSAPGDAGSS